MYWSATATSAVHSLWCPVTEVRIIKFAVILSGIWRVFARHMEAKDLRLFFNF